MIIKKIITLKNKIKIAIILKRKRSFFFIYFSVLNGVHKILYYYHYGSKFGNKKAGGMSQSETVFFIRVNHKQKYRFSELYFKV